MADIYAALREGLLVATSEPAGWRSWTRFDGQHVECLGISPEMPEQVFCGTFGDGLYRSDDGGENFNRIDSKVFESDQFTAVDVSSHDPAVVWAGTEPSEVYQSTDGGDTWEKRSGLTDVSSADEWWFPARPDSHRARSLLVDPQDPNRVFVGVELGAFLVTPDAGETWTEEVPGARWDIHQIVTHAVDGIRLYAASGFGYAESRDGGDSWDQPDDDLEEQYHHLWSVAPDPGDPNIVVVSTSEDAFAAHFDPPEAYLHRYTGDGWERVDGEGTLTGEGAFAASLAPGADAGELYGVNNHGVFRTTDAGETWTSVDISWPVAFEEQDPRGLVVIP